MQSHAMQSHEVPCSPMQSHAVPCSPVQSHAVNDEDTLTGAIKVGSVSYDTIGI